MILVPLGTAVAALVAMTVVGSRLTRRLSPLADGVVTGAAFVAATAAMLWFVLTNMETTR